MPLGILLGFIVTCCIFKYCQRPQVSDIRLRAVDEDLHIDSIDYSRLLDPAKQKNDDDKNDKSPEIKTKTLDRSLNKSDSYDSNNSAF